MALRARANDEDVALHLMSSVFDLTRDHAQPLVGTEEPATDALKPLQHLDPFANVDAHLHALFHHLQRAIAVVRVQQLKEGVSCVLCTHAPMVP